MDIRERVARATDPIIMRALDWPRVRPVGPGTQYAIQDALKRANLALAAVAELLIDVDFHQAVVRHLQSLSDEPWPPYPAEVLAATAELIVEDLTAVPAAGRTDLT
jgi:hypothetical protein